MSYLLTVEFPDVEALRAAVDAVAAVVNEQPGDETLPIYRAERALDSALLAIEQQQWAPERPTETADFPPTDEFAGEHAIEEDPDDRP